MQKARIPAPAQLLDWLRRQQSRKVIRAVEAAPREQRTAEHTLRLAQAYLDTADIGTPSGRQQLQHARDLLTSIQAEADTLEDPFVWYASMATSSFFGDDPAAAYPYAQRAIRLKPENPMVQAILHGCQMVQQRPRARWTFREGVVRAWNKFFQRQPSFLRQLAEEPMGRCSERLERPISFCFEAALFAPDCSVWKTGEKPRLVFDTHCNPIRMLQLLNLLQQAPEAVLDAWDLQLGPLPDRDSPAACRFYLIFGDTPVQLLTDKSGEIVAATIDGFPLFFFETQEEMQSAALKKPPVLRPLIVRLGPVPLWRLGTKLHRKLSLGPTVPLRDLSETLAANGLDCSVASARRALPWNPYEVHRPFHRKVWRQQAEVGDSRFPTLAYDTGDRLLFFSEKTILEGVEGGYLVWPVPRGLPWMAIQKADQLLQEIQDKLYERLGIAYLTVLGLGVDLHFAYLDFVAWDLQSVLEAAADLLQEVGLPWAAYHPFRDFEPAVSLFGFPAPPLQRR